MALLRISESKDWIVDYDTDRGMYRVSFFEGYHFQDECWFDAYEEKEIGVKDVPLPIKRVGEWWWEGHCPRCNQYITYNFENGYEQGYRNHYCWKCGQLCDFNDV